MLDGVQACMYSKWSILWLEPDTGPTALDAFLAELSRMSEEMFDPVWVHVPVVARRI